MLFILMNKDYSYSIKSKILTVEFDEGTNEEKINIINQNYNIELEKMVRDYPNQYFWFHRRFPRSIYH